MSYTRGYGLLEGFLAKKRAEKANSLIPGEVRHGRILDIGCGSFPYFLCHTQFAHKYGLDKSLDEADIEKLKKENILLLNHNIENDGVIPFQDGYFDVVTMLAVIEHITPEKVIKFIREVKRVLKSGGFLIITTPAPWCDRLLRILAFLYLVSKEEIEDHKAAYSASDIIFILESSGFKKSRIKTGYFELFMNIWAVAENI